MKTCKVTEVKAKSIITRSKLPDADYVVNPYIGCQFGCIYCYASFMGRFVGEPIANWGNYVCVKQNAVKLFEEEIKRIPRGKTILLSSVTDPYQGIEMKCKLTRGILEVLVKQGYSGKVGILTKSPLVLRDIDLLRQLPNVEVGLTVTTTDDSLSRMIEASAPLSSRRIEALKQLNKNGIKTYAFVGPLLPRYVANPELLDNLFKRLKEAGVRDVYIEHLNLSPYIRKRIQPYLADKDLEDKGVFEEISEEHKREWQSTVRKLLHKYGMRLRLNHVISHHERG